MKNFSLVISNDNYYESADLQRVYIFHNVKGYEEEINNMIENMCEYTELNSIVESWGGKMKLVLMRDLITSYCKDNKFIE